MQRYFASLLCLLPLILGGCANSEPSLNSATQVANTAIALTDARGEIEAVIAEVDRAAVDWPLSDQSAWTAVTVETRQLLDRLAELRSSSVLPSLTELTPLLQQAEALYGRGAALVHPHMNEIGELGRLRLARFRDAHDGLQTAYAAYQANQTAQTAAQVLDTAIRLGTLAVKLGVVVP